jgi:hypothetical protein
MTIIKKFLYKTSLLYVLGKKICMQGNISIKKLHYTIDNLKKNCKHEKNTPSPFTVLIVRSLGTAHLPFEGGGGGDLLLAGNFWDRYVQVFFSVQTPCTIFFSTLSFAAFFFQ